MKKNKDKFKFGDLVRFCGWSSKLDEEDYGSDGTPFNWASENDARPIPNQTLAIVLDRTSDYKGLQSYHVLLQIDKPYSEEAGKHVFYEDEIEKVA